jgi:hypothetical protein
VYDSVLANAFVYYPFLKMKVLILLFVTVLTLFEPLFAQSARSLIVHVGGEMKPLQDFEFEKENLLFEGSKVPLNCVRLFDTGEPIAGPIVSFHSKLEIRSSRNLSGNFEPSYRYQVALTSPIGLANVYILVPEVRDPNVFVVKNIGSLKKNKTKLITLVLKESAPDRHFLLFSQGRELNTSARGKLQKTARAIAFDTSGNRECFVIKQVSPEAVQISGVKNHFAKISFTVSSDGVVKDVQVIEATSKQFGESCVQGISKSIYYPAHENWKAVDTRLTVPVTSFTP